MLSEQEQGELSNLALEMAPEQDVGIAEAILGVLTIEFRYELKRHLEGLKPGPFDKLLRDAGLPARFDELPVQDIAQISVRSYPQPPPLKLYRAPLERDDRLEWLCEIMAAVILCPKPAFIQDVEKGRTVAEMAELYQVEEYVMRWRAVILGELHV